jgi:hypothetical protein
VHALAAPAEDVGSEVRSDTTEVDRFTAARVTAFFTALVTALTALFTAFLCELPSARKLPLARDTSAKPTASDKAPSKIFHLLRADDLIEARD